MTPKKSSPTAVTRKRSSPSADTLTKAGSPPQPIKTQPAKRENGIIKQQQQRRPEKLTKPRPPPQQLRGKENKYPVSSHPVINRGRQALTPRQQKPSLTGNQRQIEKPAFVVSSVSKLPETLRETQSTPLSEGDEELEIIEVRATENLEEDSDRSSNNSQLSIRAEEIVAQVLSEAIMEEDKQRYLQTENLRLFFSLEFSQSKQTRRISRRSVFDSVQALLELLRCLRSE